MLENRKWRPGNHLWQETANQKPHCSRRAAEPARTRKVPGLHSHRYLHSACLSDKPWITTRNHHSLRQVVITAVVVSVVSLPENMLRLPVPCSSYRLGKGLFLPTPPGPQKAVCFLLTRASPCLCCPTGWWSTLQAHVRSELPGILRVFLSTRYHAVPLHWWYCADWPLWARSVATRIYW